MFVCQEIVSSKPRKHYLPTQSKTCFAKKNANNSYKKYFVLNINGTEENKKNTANWTIIKKLGIDHDSVVTKNYNNPANKPGKKAENKIRLFFSTHRWYFFWLKVNAVCLGHVMILSTNIVIIIFFSWLAPKDRVFASVVKI